MPKAALPLHDTRPAGEAWTRRLRFRHLEVLLAIARHGSLTATGEALDITQPAVSQWLADIEAAAGAPLFIRGQRLKPTPFAAPLLAHAQRVLNDAQRTLAELQAIREGGSGRVRIGTMQVGAAALVPAVVLRLRQAAPGIGLSLLEDVTAGLWSRFERNELDLLVTRLDARSLASGMPSRRLFADRHRVICGPHHPLARRRRLGWPDVARYPWLMPTEGTPLHRALEASFAGAGLPLPATMVTSVSSVANGVLLAQTDVLGLLSSVLAERLQRQGLVAALPLTLSPDVGDVGLVWREAEPGPALAAVLRAFDEECPVAAPAAALAASPKADAAIQPGRGPARPGSRRRPA